MQDALTPVRLLRYNSLRIPWEKQIRAHLRAAASSRAYISIGSTSRLNFLALFLGVHSYSRANHGSFGLGSYSDFLFQPWATPVFIDEPLWPTTTM
jgi:hypothetical protein